MGEIWMACCLKCRNRFVAGPITVVRIEPFDLVVDLAVCYTCIWDAPFDNE